MSRKRIIRSAQDGRFANGGSAQRPISIGSNESVTARRRHIAAEIGRGQLVVVPHAARESPRVAVIAGPTRRMMLIRERADGETNLAVMRGDEIRHEIAELVGNPVVSGSSTASADASSWRKCLRPCSGSQS